ncbi:MAG: hypothetical protein QF575_05740 [Acidimicrobiales bacterium]|nr:hypothetical protein [Acidimicrobiales bacterium]
METPVQALAQGEEEVSGDLGLTGGLGRLVLPLHLAAESGHATVEQDPPQQALFLGQFGQGGVAVGPPGAETWRPGLGRSLVASAPAFVRPLGAFGAGSAVASISASITATATSLTVASASITVASASITATALAARPAIPIVVARSSAAHEAGRHRGLVVPVAEHLEQIGLGTGASGGEHGHDRDAVEVLFGLHPEDVSHRGTGSEEGAVEVSTRLAGASRPPRPGAIVAEGGELDLDAWHGGER